MHLFLSSLLFLSVLLSSTSFSSCILPSLPPHLAVIRYPAATWWWCLYTLQSSPAARYALGPPCTSMQPLQLASWWWLWPVTWSGSGGSTKSSSPFALHPSSSSAGSSPRRLFIWWPKAATRRLRPCWTPLPAATASSAGWRRRSSWSRPGRRTEKLCWSRM